MKKQLIISLLLLSFFPFLYANEESGRKENEMEKTEIDKIASLPLPAPYGFYFGAKFSLNKIDEEQKFQTFATSAMFGFEYNARISKHFEIVPSFDLTLWHYLLAGEVAAHSEPENRTAFTIAFSFELPFMVAFDIERFSISFGVSLATFIRGSVLDLGIKAEEGAEENGISAKEEVKRINQYHWKSGRWFYPAVRFESGYVFESGWRAGLIFASYIPIFNIWNKAVANTKSGKVGFLHDAIFSIAISVHPPQKEYKPLSE